MSILDLFRFGRRAEIERLFVEQQRDAMDHNAHDDALVSLEDAGLAEERQQPLFGNPDVYRDGEQERLEGGVYQYLDWFYDGDTSPQEVPV